jgi:hypothetical protein
MAGVLKTARLRPLRLGEGGASVAKSYRQEPATRRGFGCAVAAPADAKINAKTDAK